MLDEKDTIEYIRRAKGGDQEAKQALAVEESFYFSIQCFIDCLKQGEMRCLHNERKK